MLRTLKRLSALVLCLTLLTGLLTLPVGADYDSAPQQTASAADLSSDDTGSQPETSAPASPDGDQGPPPMEKTGSLAATIALGIIIFLLIVVVVLFVFMMSKLKKKP